MTASASSPGDTPSKITRPLLVIVGPTAVGKTSLALDLARQYSGEIVSADSRLIYRGMNIGTAKPSEQERRDVKHHLVDLCWPDETISLGQYKRLASAAIDEIQTREKLPILAGGTGQYIRAVVQGWKIPEVPPNAELRNALNNMDRSELERWLRVLDPESAGKIDPRNVRRVIRALEVTLVTGHTMSSLRGSSPPGYNFKTIGLSCEREILYGRIDSRIDEMMASGLLEEVISLKDKGYDEGTSAMSGLGYRQLLAYLRGEGTIDEAVERTKYETHRFARQQYNWFRLDDDTITWFDVTRPTFAEKISIAVRNWLETSN